jgi:sulfatase maturation enzyme AslB (radical SAM superfamily)
MNIKKNLQCLLPWISLEVFQDGEAYFCCPAFSKVQLGDMNKSSLKEIWDGLLAQRVRLEFSKNKISNLCNSNCPRLVDSEFFLSKDFELLNSNCKSSLVRSNISNIKKNIINNNSAIETWPLRLNLSNWMFCNLNCKMCFSDVHKLPMPDHVKKLWRELKDFIPYLREVILSGAGEPFLRADTLELMKNYDASVYPDLKFAIISNGNLIFDQWEKVKHCNFSWFNISIDAATKQTYEKIRIGGDWNRLQKSLGLLARESKVRRFEVQISMVVMRSNYKEIIMFVEMANKFGFFATLSKIRGCAEENIFDTPMDEGIKKELIEILRSPIMKSVRMPEFNDYID